MRPPSRGPRVLLAAAALAALAAAAGFCDAVDAALARSPYTPPEREELAALLRSAAEDGIPLQMTLPRLEEGIAKRVPAARVEEVVAAGIERLVRGRRLLQAAGPAARLGAAPAAWQRAATLIEWGASDEEIAAIARASGGRLDYFVEGAGLLVSLSRWGLARPLAVDLAAAAAASAVPAGDLPGVASILSAGRKARRDITELARELAAQLGAARSIRQVRERVLHEQEDSRRGQGASARPPAGDRAAPRRGRGF